MSACLAELVDLHSRALPLRRDVAMALRRIGLAMSVDAAVGLVKLADTEGVVDTARLAELIGTTRGSYEAARLHDMGMITVRPCERDRRRNRITITAAGRQMVAALREAMG